MFTEKITVLKKVLFIYMYLTVLNQRKDIFLEAPFQKLFERYSVDINEYKYLELKCRRPNRIMHGNNK